MRRAVAWALLFGGCVGVAELPPGEGQGLISVDRAVPAGLDAAVERPNWRVGDRFRFRRGGESHLVWRVARAGAEGYELVEEATGVVTLLDADLGVQGETVGDDPAGTRRLAPADNEWTWPLWVGKRWSSHYLRKAPGVSIPVQANYHCDLREPVTVPAGTFDCLRVWRAARPMVEGRFLEKASVAWYAPAVGYFVKRLEDGVLLELEAVHRQD